MVALTEVQNMGKQVRVVEASDDITASSPASSTLALPYVQRDQDLASGRHVRHYLACFAPVIV